MRLHLSLFSILLIFLSPGRSTALINLSIIRPVSEFTTNNQLLQIEGEVETSTPAEVTVSINTPAGVRDFTRLKHPLYATTIDLGSSQELRGLLIRPVMDGDIPLGPRVIGVAFSQDDAEFPETQRFTVPSSIDPVLQRTIVSFPTVIPARFIRVEMLDGWQAGKMAIESIEFFDTSNQIIQGRIQAISIRLDLTQQRRALFSLEVLLKADENQLLLVAQVLSPSIPDSPDMVDQKTISLFYLPELQPEAADEGRFILSDGSHLSIAIPADALGENIQRLQFFSIPPAQIDPFSYLRNTRIVKGTAPVIAYRFEALRQGGFAAEATNSLPNQPPELAADGILEPPSTWMAGLVPLPVSLTIDLGSLQTVSRMVVHANVVDGESFGPESARILTSDDNENFIEILEAPSFNDQTTVIELPTLPSARYFRLEITESKQANNIQLNEVEFFDASGTKIVPFETFEHLLLQRPMVLELSYGTSDLAAANITREADLKVFAWDALAQEWQFAGGEIVPNRRVVRLELNYISQIALFQSAPSQIQAVWSFNPFSPDGNGIADTSRLTIVNPEELPIGQPELVVEIFDLHNRRVRTLINRTTLGANAVSVEWDGRNQTGEIVHIGPYIYQIRLGSQVRNGVIVVGK